jgi:hypothetical protein
MNRIGKKGAKNQGAECERIGKLISFNNHTKAAYYRQLFSF